MDEEIIQRIVYIILGIIFFVIFSSKKKTPQQQTVPQKTTSTSDIPSKEKKDIFVPVEKLENRQAQNKSEFNYETLEDEDLEDEDIEEKVLSEILADPLKERTAIAKQQKIKIQENQSDSSFTITHDDLKKAVILSDIIQPKYF